VGMKIENIVFDLDGTLIEPQEGIINSILYSIEKHNLTKLSSNELRQFIGPPLIESYIHFFNLTREDAKTAVDSFRDYFSEKGLYENFLYPKVKDTLLALNKKKYSLFIATSKPTFFAEKILKYHKIHSLFKGIVGSTMDHKRIEKTDIIQYLLTIHRLNPKECIMIGDRKFDILGARNCKLVSAAVSYGHGSKEEIENAKPDYIIDSFSEIFRILDTHNL
jgi:phosphoglycolate phosphatase